MTEHRITTMAELPDLLASGWTEAPRARRSHDGGVVSVLVWREHRSVGDFYDGPEAEAFWASPGMRALLALDWVWRAWRWIRRIR